MDKIYMKNTVHFLTTTHTDIMDFTQTEEFMNEPLEAQALFIASANSIAATIVAFQAFEFIQEKREKEQLFSEDTMVN